MSQDLAEEHLKMKEENEILKALLSSASQELKAYQAKYPISPWKKASGGSLEKPFSLQPLFESYDTTIVEQRATIRKFTEDFVEVQRANHNLNQLLEQLRHEVEEMKNENMELATKCFQMTQQYNDVQSCNETLKSEFSDFSTSAAKAIGRLETKLSEFAENEERYVHELQQQDAAIAALQSERDKALARCAQYRSELTALHAEKMHVAQQRHAELSDAVHTVRAALSRHESLPTMMMTSSTASSSSLPKLPVSSLKK